MHCLIWVVVRVKDWDNRIRLSGPDLDGRDILAAENPSQGRNFGKFVILTPRKAKYPLPTANASSYEPTYMSCLQICNNVIDI